MIYIFQGKSLADSSSDVLKRGRAQVLDVLSKDFFPCIFGRKAADRDTIFWASLERESDNDMLKNIFVEYTDFLSMTPAKERLLSPLVLLVNAESATTLFEQHKFAWKILERVHHLDPSDWPSDIPRDPDHHGWTFCFNGVQLFVNISAPGHRILKSRNLGEYVCLVVNPREIFDIVAPGGTKKGNKIRDEIRARIARFNGTDVSPSELGSFGDEDSFEWKQYQLYERGAMKNNRCPIRMLTSRSR